MSAVHSYEAWFFFAADDIDEVNREYEKFGTDDEGWQRYPDRNEDFVDRVRVIAVEETRTGTQVWFLRDGLAEQRPSWMVREANIGKPIESEKVPA